MNDDRSPLYIASLEFIQKYDEKDFESKKRVDHPKVEQAKEEKQKQEEIAQAAIREKNEQIAAQKISVPQVRPSTKEESMGIARKVDNLIRIIVEARKDINKTAFEKFSYVFEKIKKAQENPVTRYLNDDRWKSFVSFWNEKTSEISDADRPHINAEQKKQLGMSIRYFFHLLAGEDPFEEYSQYNKEFLEALRWLEM
jgi:lipopolysaccharide export LptBFGC system permease protein LptF